MTDSTPFCMAWDGRILAWYHPEAGLQHEELSIETDDALPESGAWQLISDHDTPVAIWYAESLLTRNIHLPLASTAMLDNEMLQQELVERAGINAGEWWLCRDFSRDPEGGIRGMVFAMPDALKQSMQQHPHWQQLTHLGVDLWHRLQQWKHEDAAAQAIVDEDADGLCLGFHRQGCWYGMRRLNGTVDEHLWQEALCSLQAMGFDMAQHTLTGQLSGKSVAHIEAAGGQWQGETLDELLPRYHASLRTISAGVAKSAMNFRHGQWAASGSWQAFRPWWRSLALAGCMVLLAVAALLHSNAQLEGRIAAQQARLMTAFHQGLPKETVIIDPLAQLRRANAATEQQTDTRLTHDLQVIASIYRELPWQLQRLSLQRGTMQLSGNIRDIQTLNKLQQQLQQKLGYTVSVIDTNLGEDQLGFRLEWSWS